MSDKLSAQFDNIFKDFKTSFESMGKDLSTTAKSFDSAIDDVANAARPGMKAAGKYLDESGVELEKSLDKMALEMSGALKPTNKQLKEMGSDFKALGKEFKKAGKEFENEFNAAYDTVKPELRNLGNQLKAIGKSVEKELDKTTAKLDPVLTQIGNDLEKSLDSGLSKVLEFTEHRRKEVAGTKKLVTMLKDTSDYGMARLTNTIAKNIGSDKTTTELSRAANEVSNIVASVLKEIPDRVKSKNFEEDVLFSQFSALTQQMFMSDDIAKNVEGLVSTSAKSLATTVDALTKDVDKLGEDALSFMDEFSEIVKKVPVPSTIDKMTAAIPDVTQTIQEALAKTSALQSRINSGLDFSDFRITDLVGSLNKISSIIPSKGAEFPFSDSAMTMVDRASSAISTMQQIQAWKTRLENYKDQVATIIKPGDIFNKNFSQIYKALGSSTSMLGSIPAMLKSNPASAMSAFGDLKSKADAIAGMVTSLGNTKIKDKLSDVTSQANAQMQSFARRLKNIELPFEGMDKLKYNLKAITKTAEKYATGTLKTAAPTIIDALRKNTESILGTVKSSLNTFKTVLNAYDPPATTDVKVFMDSIGKIAPAARDAIIQGQITDFKKTLESPAFLTKADNAVAALGEFSAKVRTKLTSADMNMINIVSNYLSGEHKRAMMSMWIANLASQRSSAAKSLDSFVSSFIHPIEIITQLMQSKYPDV